jgi:N-acetylneuraminic acid mutarotase
MLRSHSRHLERCSAHATKPLYHDVCIVGDAIYVLGGSEDGSRTSSVLMFDSGAQVWSAVAPMPRALHNCRACALGSDIFLFGGYGSDEDGDETPPTVTTRKPRTETDVWSTLTPVPEAIMSHSVCVVSGLIYATGGARNSDSESEVSSAHRFDPAMDTWSTVHGAYAGPPGRPGDPRVRREYPRCRSC